MTFYVGSTIKLDQAAIAKYVKAKERHVLTTAGMIIEADVKEILSNSYSPSSNRRTYTVTEGGKKHTASAPGEPPAVLTGRLRASITWDFSSAIKTVKIGSSNQLMRNPEMPVVGVPVNYAVELEYGTDKVAPRPFMRPVRDKYHGNNRLAERIGRHLRAIGKAG